jgi:hypothetical protein
MIAQQNQTLLDIAIMATGTIESVFSIAQANDISITDIPVPGNDYIIPTGTLTDNNALQYLAQNGVTIGTKGQTLPLGIGYWIIETDFTVS